MTRQGQGLCPCAREANRIDDGMTVAGWTRLLHGAGFALTDVLLRDADQVIIAALKRE